MNLTLYLNRLISLLPKAWFSDGAILVGGVTYLILYLMASELLACWNQIQYVILQTRISTATDTNIDTIASDLFGTPDMVRYSGESDAAYIARIKARLVAPQPTLAEIQSEVNAYFAQNPASLSGVVVFDQQSDPNQFAFYNLPTNRAVIGIALYVPTIDIFQSFFLGQAFLGQNTFLENQQTFFVTPSVSPFPGLTDLIARLHAAGTLPMFIVAFNDVGNFLAWDVGNWDDEVWGS